MSDENIQRSTAFARNCGEGRESNSPRFALDSSQPVERILEFGISLRIQMPAEVKKEIQLEIAHVLFIDIVGYSKLSD